MRLRSLVIALFALLSAAPACAAASTPPVLATIKPIHSLVAAVMAGVGTPQLLIGGAVSEHSYVLKPSDAEKIASAKVVFWVGPDLETYLIARLGSLAPDTEVVALQDAPGVRGLPARPGGFWPAPAGSDGHINPHLWLDPRNAIAMTRAIAAALSRADPANAKRYAANAAGEARRIENLDSVLAAKLAPVHASPYIVFHDAYQYFEAHYHLNAIAAVTVEPDRPVGPRRIVELREAIKAGKALCIFREPQFAPALIETLAADTPIRIGVLDPLGADLSPGPDLYPALMTRLAASVVRCLSPHHP